MSVTLPIIMMLTGLATLMSIATQILSGTRGRPLLIKQMDMMTYICLSTAGMGLFISGLAKLFGGHWWMAVPITLWSIGMVRLIQTYKSSRYSPRTCQDCGFNMVRMGRGERFLTKRQKIEEKIQSREYDLWVCTNGHRQMFMFPGKFGEAFKKCHSCLVHAVYGEKQIVTPAGIYVDTHCVACDARVKKEN